MMRSLWVAVLSLTLILLMHGACDYAGRQVAAQLMQDCRYVNRMVQDNEPETAVQYLLQMEQEWNKQADFLALFSNHQRANRVREQIITARIALETEQAFEFRRSMAEMEEAAKSLYEEDAFLLKNIW